MILFLLFALFCSGLRTISGVAILARLPQDTPRHNECDRVLASIQNV
jgi:hypothetical protein